MKTLGENLKEIRTKRKLSRRELAEISGVSQGYITSIEFNKKNPTMEIITKLADALKVKTEYLTKDTNEKGSIKTFGTELDKLCEEMGIDVSTLDEEDIELITAKILVLINKLSKEKETD